MYFAFHQVAQRLYAHCTISYRGGRFGLVLTLRGYQLSGRNFLCDHSQPPPRTFSKVLQKPITTNPTVWKPMQSHFCHALISQELLGRAHYYQDFRGNLSTGPFSLSAKVTGAIEEDLSPSDVESEIHGLVNRSYPQNAWRNMASNPEYTHVKHPK